MNRQLPFRTDTLSLIAVLTLFSLQAVLADEGIQCCGEPPELWLISSRCAPKSDCLESGFEQLTYDHYDRCSRKLVRKSRESFLAAQSQIPTLLFAHGNRNDEETALRSAALLYESLRLCPGPKLLVFWSWPSETYYTRPVLRPVLLAKSNIRIKYSFAEHQGYYIAKLVNMMSTTEPLTLSGHSFGGLAVISALHLLAGGTIDAVPRMDVAAMQDTPNLRAAVFAAALDHDSLYQGQRYDLALSAVERFYISYNDRDPALRRWPNHSCRGQAAMGYQGACLARFGEQAIKVQQERLTCEIGKTHYMEDHLNSCALMRSLCNLAFDSQLRCCPRSSCRLSSPAGSIDIQRIIESPATTVFPGLAL